MEESFSIDDLTDLQIFFYLLDNDYSYNEFKNQEDNKASFEYDSLITNKFQKRKKNKVILLIRLSLIYYSALLLFPIGLLILGQIFDDIEIPSKREIKRFTLLGFLGMIYIGVTTFFIFKWLYVAILTVIVCFFFVFLMNSILYIKARKSIQSNFNISI